MRDDREQASLAAWTDWMRKRRGADDPYKPTERVRREPADATRDPKVEERRRAQERFGRQGTMGVPSGLQEEPLGQRVARLGAEVLPPVSVPAMWGAGKKAMRGDLGGALDDATAELLMAAAMPVAGRLKKVAGAAEALTPAAAKAAQREAEVRTFKALRREQPLVGPLDPVAGNVSVPKKGVFQKPEEGVTKTSSIPSKKEIRGRLDEADAMLRTMERDADTWQPLSRGILDRTGFDPHHRMKAGSNSLVKATGQLDPVLAEALDNPKLMNLMERQVNLGLRLGGEGFYNLKPLANAYEETDGPLSFRDWVGASSAGSIQAPLPQEMANASIMLFAKANGLSYADAVAELKRRYPQSQSPWFSKGHSDVFDKYQATGTIDPSSGADGARKVPTYFRQKLGESHSPTELRTSDNPMGSVVDTHESKAVLYPIGLERYMAQMTGRQYDQVADLYRTLGQRMDLPAETIQAGRWLGGGPLTGLKSPRGDYVQGFEDALYRSAERTGKDLSLPALRRYRDDVLQGRDFILPYYGK